jgi:hypothetical protein
MAIREVEGGRRHANTPDTQGFPGWHDRSGVGCVYRQRRRGRDDEPLDHHGRNRPPGDDRDHHHDDGVDDDGADQFDESSPVETITEWEVVAGIPGVTQLS